MATRTTNIWMPCWYWCFFSACCDALCSDKKCPRAKKIRDIKKTSWLVLFFVFAFGACFFFDPLAFFISCFRPFPPAFVVPHVPFHFLLLFFNFWSKLRSSLSGFHMCFWVFVRCAWDWIALWIFSFLRIFEMFSVLSTFPLFQIVSFFNFLNLSHRKRLRRTFRICISYTVFDVLDLHNLYHHHDKSPPPHHFFWQN